MAKQEEEPDIITEFDSVGCSPAQADYTGMIRRTLKLLIPDYFCGKVGRETRERLHQSLPLVTMSQPREYPFSLSLFLVTEYRRNSFKFFFDMISTWLIPGEKLDITLFYGVDFLLPRMSEKRYTLCEAVIRVENQEIWEAIQSNFSLVGSELRLGVSSPYFARRILEVKGLSTDQKTALVQEHITYILKRLPDHIHQDIFSEMQHVLIQCSDNFKFQRDSRHISRVISVHYLFRRWLFESCKIAPNRRHLYLKLFHAHLTVHERERRVLGIVVGLNYLDTKEVFEDKHLIKAVQTYIPNVHGVEGSFFLNRRGTEKVATLYMELEKGDSTAFSSEEIKLLRNALPNDLKDRIEHMLHPVFMPRNEEEIMRNALSLAGQIQYAQDPSQVFITFDEQTYSRLFFTIIFVRLVDEKSKPIAAFFKRDETFLEFIHDWTKSLGVFRKKYTKEASSFRVAFSKEMFLREDNSIDLCKARQIVFLELDRLFGSLRDYNGGMITKQNELLTHVRALLADEGISNDFLLENFFYAVTPSQMRNLLDPDALKILFLLMTDVLELQEERNPYVLRMHRELDQVFVMITSSYEKFREYLQKSVEKLNIPSMELASVFVHANDTPCLGYIYRCEDPYSQEHFCQTILMALCELDGNRDSVAL